MNLNYYRGSMRQSSITEGDLNARTEPCFYRYSLQNRTNINSNQNRFNCSYNRKSSIQMPFRYRLQKILDFRINQKEEQRMKVQKAQQAVYQAEQDIKKNNQDILDTKEGMRVANPMMYESYDNFLQHLWQKAEQLEAVRQDLQKKLDIEVQKLVKFVLIFQPKALVKFVLQQIAIVRLFVW